MPVIFSVLFAALILIALFKLFFDDFEDWWASFRDFLLWIPIELIAEWLSPWVGGQTSGLRFMVWFAVGVIGGFMLYYRLT